jgi:hypothetical protein
MFGERGYLTFPRRAMARKPPQGFIAWCCSCCCPKASREEPGGVEVIHVCPRAEENFDEAGGNKLAVQKKGCAQRKETRYSDEGRMARRVMQRSHACEKWRPNKDSVEVTEMGVPMLEYQYLVHSTYEDGADGGRGMQSPEIGVHRAQGVDEGMIHRSSRVSYVIEYSNLNLLTLSILVNGCGHMG